jgi:hypothetical protein
MSAERLQSRQSVLGAFLQRTKPPSKGRRASLRGTTFVRRPSQATASAGANTPWLCNGSARPVLLRESSFLPAARGSSSEHLPSADLAPIVRSLGRRDVPNLSPSMPRWLDYEVIARQTQAIASSAIRIVSPTISAAMSISVVDIKPLNSPPVLTSTISKPSLVSMMSTPASLAPTA